MKQQKEHKKAIWVCFFVNKGKCAPWQLFYHVHKRKIKVKAQSN